MKETVFFFLRHEFRIFFPIKYFFNRRSLFSLESNFYSNLNAKSETPIITYYMDPITYSSFQWDKRKNQIIIILFFRRMNFPWFSDKSWRRLVCFFAAAIWRIFLLFAFSDGWIGFFLAEIVHPFGWIWRFGRFSRSFSTHSLWFFHVCLKKVGLTLSLRDLCSESLVMHSLFIRQSFTQIGPLKP